MQWIIENKSLAVMSIILLVVVVVLVALLIVDFVKRNSKKEVPAKEEVKVEKAPVEKAPVLTYKEAYDALEKTQKSFVNKLVKHAKEAEGAEVKVGKMSVAVKEFDQALASLKIEGKDIVCSVSVQNKNLVKVGYKLKPVKVVVSDKETCAKALEVFDEAFKTAKEVASL